MNRDKTFELRDTSLPSRESDSNTVVPGEVPSDAILMRLIIDTVVEAGIKAPPGKRVEAMITRLRELMPRRWYGGRRDEEGT